MNVKIQIWHLSFVIWIFSIAYCLLPYFTASVNVITGEWTASEASRSQA
jgi:hypothetical protein